MVYPLAATWTQVTRHVHMYIYQAFVLRRQLVCISHHEAKPGICCNHQAGRCCRVLCVLQSQLALLSLYSGLNATLLAYAADAYQVICALTGAIASN